MTDDRRTPEPLQDPAAAGERALDVQVEDLTRRIAEVVNQAGGAGRSDLREYAIGLLKEETEFAEAPAAETQPPHARGFNPLAFALLLALASVPLLLSGFFSLMGVLLLAIAGVMGIWGVLIGLLRRPPRRP